MVLYRVRCYWQHGSQRGQCKREEIFFSLEEARNFRSSNLSQVSSSLDPVIQVGNTSSIDWRYFEG